MTAPTLHTIAADIAAILDTEDGELAPETEARLDGLQLDLSAKLDGICRYMEQCNATAHMRDEAAKRLTELARADAAKAHRLRQYVMGCLQSLGIKKYDTELYKLSLCKNSQPSVRMDAEMDVPKEYARVKVELDREAVVRAWKEGWPLPAGISCEVGQHLRVK